ncbi:MAG: hypothetical protein ACTTJV_10110 [Ottowia sp.]
MKNRFMKTKPPALADFSLSKQKMAARFFENCYLRRFHSTQKQERTKADGKCRNHNRRKWSRKTALVFPMHPAINRARLRGMWGNPCRSHLVASFRLKIRQTFCSARKHCEVRYQFRNFLWISALQQAVFQALAGSKKTASGRFSFWAAARSLKLRRARRSG